MKLPNRRWVAQPDRLTPTPVPFQLQAGPVHEAAQRFVERADGTRRAALFFSIVPAFLAILTGVLAFLGGSWGRDVWVMLAIVILLAALSAFGYYAGGWQRALSLDGRRRIVRIERVRARRSAIEAEESLDACRLRVHPVMLVIMRSRAGSPMLHWKGQALLMEVGTERFVLACDKSRDVLDRYRSRLPTWVSTMQCDEGPLIEADAHKRVL